MFTYIYMIFILPLLNAVTFGYSSSVLWGWFVVPVFDAPVISWSVAAGLTLVANSIMPILGLRDDDQSPGKVAGKFTFYALFLPFYLLVVGWVIKTYCL